MGGASHALAGNLTTLDERFGLTGSVNQRGELGAAIVPIRSSVGYEGLAFGAPDGSTSSRGLVARWQDIGAGWQEGVPPTSSPTPAVNDRFGERAASFGSRLLVSETNPPELHIFDVVGAAGGTTLSQSLQPQLVGVAGSRQSVSVASFADYFAVGVNRNQADSGTVELFRLNAGQWVSTGQVLADPGPAPQAGFGQSLAMTEDRLFVGTPNFAPVAGEVLPGVVWVYSRPTSGTTWNLSGFLIISDAAVPQLPLEQEAEFGFAVAVQGPLLAVGAPGLRLTSTSPRIGAVLIYRFDPAQNRWQFEGFVGNPDAGVDARFGDAVAVGADEVLVGAPNEAGGDGRAYVLRRAGDGTWQARYRLRSVASGAHDYGRSVAFASNGSYAVGAPAFPAGGAVYLYRRPEVFANGFEP